MRSRCSRGAAKAEAEAWSGNSRTASCPTGQSFSLSDCERTLRRHEPLGRGVLGSRPSVACSERRARRRYSGVWSLRGRNSRPARPCCCVWGRSERELIRREAPGPWGPLGTTGDHRGPRGTTGDHREPRGPPGTARGPRRSTCQLWQRQEGYLGPRVETPLRGATHVGEAPSPWA